MLLSSLLLARVSGPEPNRAHCRARGPEVQARVGGACMSGATTWLVAAERPSQEVGRREDPQNGFVRMRACAWQSSARRLIALDARGVASIDRTQSTGVQEVRSRKASDGSAARTGSRAGRRPARDPASWWSRARPDPLRVRDRQLVGSRAARRAAQVRFAPVVDSPVNNLQTWIGTHSGSFRRSQGCQLIGRTGAIALPQHV